MATRNEVVARRFADAVTRADCDAAVGLCHPQVEFASMLGISGRAYIGHDGIRQYFDDVESAWAYWTVDVERVSEGPDGRVAIVMTMHARGKESGVALNERTAHIWTLSEGRLSCNEPYRRPDEALRSLGLAPTA